MIGGALLGGTFMGITAVGMTTARELAVNKEGGDPRRMLGLIVAAFGAGQMIGPAFAGFVTSITGSFTVPSITATAALVFAAGLAMLVKWTGLTPGIISLGLLNQERPIFITLNPLRACLPSNPHRQWHFGKIPWAVFKWCGECVVPAVENRRAR